MITSQYFNITSDASIFASNRHISNKQHCAVWVKSLTNVWSQIPYNDFDLVNNSIILDTALLSTIYSQVELRVADSQEELGTPVTDISTTASIRDKVIVVADNIDSITTVSENIVNLNNIADNIVKAGVVADNIVDVNNVADNIVSVSSLASIRTQLESLYADKTKLTSIYNDKITLDSIYSDKSKLDAIFSDLNAIEGLFSIKAKLESIYADKSKLDSLYADKTQLDTIYNNISNILTVYSSIANVITVSNNIASVNTTASNIVDVNTFSSKYKISSIQPSSPTAGDLWYDTVATVLKYYNGSSYIAVSPDITLLLTNTKFISNISIGNTTLSNWSSSFSVMEGQGGTFFASNGVATLTGSNCYYDGVNWKYKVDGTAGLQLVNQGFHTFRTAVSGLANAVITWVTQANIDANGLTGISNMYVKTDVDTLVSAKIPKISTPTTKAIARVKSDGTLENSAIIIDDNGNIGSGTQTFNGLGGSGFKNYIINGNFDIWQYKYAGLTYPQTSSGFGSDDRWSNNNVGSTKTHSQVACTDTERALFNASFFSRTVVASVAGASNYVVKAHTIENITKFAGKIVTLSFWARADSVKNIAIEFGQNFGTGGTPSSGITGISSQLIALTNTWQKKTITVTIPSIVGKTLGTEGVHTTANWITFWFDAGSSFNIRSANLGQQSGTFDIAQVQLEEGSVATPFENRPIGLELSLCQRYFEVARGGQSIAGIAVALSTNVSCSVVKRVIPTVTKKQDIYIQNTNSTSLFNNTDIYGTRFIWTPLSTSVSEYHIELFFNAEL